MNDDVNDECSVDRPYLQRVLTHFLPFPPVSYNEVQIEHHSERKLIGGRFDVIVGSTYTCDYRRPTVQIEGEQ